MGENRGSIAFFASYRPPVPLDIFCCPVPVSSRPGELHLTDGLSYNYNGQPVPPAALKTIVMHLDLAREAVIEADIDSSRLTGLVFVSEREQNLETLQIAVRFTDEGEVKVFTLADIYGTDLFSGARMEDSSCIAGYILLSWAELTVLRRMLVMGISKGQLHEKICSSFKDQKGAIAWS